MARSAYKVEGKFAEQERDVKKYWKSGQIRLTMYGLENQTEEDPDYIFRDFGYDGSEYRDQVRKRAEIRRENAKRGKAAAEAGIPFEPKPLPDFYPVVTLVLYFGARRWSTSLHLKDHLKIPDRLGEYVSDYKANVFEIAFLSDEQVARFKSDFRYVAEYFVANRKCSEGLKPTFSITMEHLTHVEEFIELMNAVTNSNRFDNLPELMAERKSGNSLTLLFDEADARGEKRGGTNKLLELIKKKVDRHKTFEQIVNECESTPGEIWPLYKSVLAEGEAAGAQLGTCINSGGGQAEDKHVRQIREEAWEEKALEDASGMLKEGDSIAKVMRISKLSEEVVRNLAKSLNIAIV